MEHKIESGSSYMTFATCSHIVVPLAIGPLRTRYPTTARHAAISGVSISFLPPHLPICGQLPFLRTFHRRRLARVRALHLSAGKTLISRAPLRAIATTY